MGKILSGARAKLGLVDTSTGVTRFVGTFESISYGFQYDIASAYILGRWTCASLDYTSVEPVQISTSGWRVVDHGPHQDGFVPKVQDLLTSEYLTMVVQDRQTLKAVATIEGVRPGGYSTSIAARQLTQISQSWTGIIVNDELTSNAEPSSSTFLPG
jgi:hypothetical protein